jgi:hypothetical protein
MPGAKRIFIIADFSHQEVKLLRNQDTKRAKGFIRLGHDVRLFSYFNALMEVSRFKTRSMAGYFDKAKVDKLLASELAAYHPDIVYLRFVRVLDEATIDVIRKAAPKAVLIGFDNDPWPDKRRQRIDIAKKLDILIASNDGSFLQKYIDAGVPLCSFMPNACDPDIDYRYQVGPEWIKNIIWTGLIIEDPKRYPGEQMRYEIISRLSKMPNCAVYGCCGNPNIGGQNSLYAISGAKIGLSINGDNNVRLYHSDRLTNYLSCGTFVLAKRVPDSDLLFKDKVHLRYFDSADEFFELAKWYLEHEDERKKIADAGMKWTHEQFNCVKIAGYVLELIEKGKYAAPWFPVR